MSEDVGVLLIRLVVGAFFVAHGCQKLLGWFGGSGIQATHSWFAAIGFRPALPLAVLTGLAELICGAGLICGVFWPLPAVLLTGPMFVAVVKVHWPRLWATEKGIEYPLVLLAVLTGIGLFGVGNFSLDEVLAIHLPLRETYAGGLILATSGAVASLIGTAVSSRGLAHATQS